MTTATDTPRIYVASLSDYNNGCLHGAWIDLNETTTADDIYESVKKMLLASPEPIAEEWAIHDYEGFGGIRLDEYESFERVAALANALAEHGEAFGAWVNGDDYRKDNPEKFEHAYLGEWDSPEDYARERLESYGVFDHVSELFENYFDWESYARDLFMELEDAPAPGGGIYVFDPNA